MNLRIRIISCIVLMLAALFCAISVVLQIAAPHALRRPAAAAAGAVYVLRDCGGSVAVYDTASARTPLHITAIETAGLRQEDRRLLDEGLAVSSQEELLTLLEDLGS